MGDLVTHLCTALLPKGVFGGRYVGSFSLGTVLPDLMARVPGITLQRIGFVKKAFIPHFSASRKVSKILFLW